MGIRFKYLWEMSKGTGGIEDMNDFRRCAILTLAKEFFPDKDSLILDVGIGLGQNLLRLKEKNYKNLIGLDVDTYSFNKLQAEGIRCIKIDVEKEALPLADSSVSVVLAFHLIEHLTDPGFFLNEVFRILRKGGYLILVTPDWRRQYKIFWRDHTHTHPYDKESILRLLRCFQFAPVYIRNYGVLKGLGRTGIWKLFKGLMFTGIDIIALMRRP